MPRDATVSLPFRKCTKNLLLLTDWIQSIPLRQDVIPKLINGLAFGEASVASHIEMKGAVRSRTSDHADKS